MLNEMTECATEKSWRIGALLFFKSRLRRTASRSDARSGDIFTVCPSTHSSSRSSSINSAGHSRGRISPSGDDFLPDGSRIRYPSHERTACKPDTSNSHTARETGAKVPPLHRMFRLAHPNGSHLGNHPDY